MTSYLSQLRKTNLARRKPRQAFVPEMVLQFVSPCWFFYTLAEIKGKNKLFFLKQVFLMFFK